MPPKVKSYRPPKTLEEAIAMERDALRKIYAVLEDWAATHPLPPNADIVPETHEQGYAQDGQE